MDYVCHFIDFRYLVEEKKRGKALDSVANFHLQNGAVRNLAFLLDLFPLLIVTK